MRIAFTINQPEHIDIVIERNWFTGKFTCTANGQVYSLRSALNPSTHFNVTLTKEFDVEVGTVHKHHILIVHTRPLLLAGFRPQKYTVTLDGELVGNYEGF